MGTPPTAPISAAEQTRSAKIGAWIFRYRSFLPVPIVVLGLALPGQPRLPTWIVGSWFVLAGEVIRVAGVAAAGTVTRRRSRTVKELVTWGIFSLMRNPLYVGNLFIWLGFAEMSGVTAMWFLPLVVVLFAVEYHFIVAYEEGVLESIFGDEYLAYKRATPRWWSVARRPIRNGEHHWADALKSERSTFWQYAAIIALLALKARYYDALMEAWPLVLGGRG